MCSELTRRRMNALLLFTGSAAVAASILGACAGNAGRQPEVGTADAAAPRSYVMGFSMEDSARMPGEAGDRDLVDQVSRAADIVSIFFHVHWNKLLGRPLLKDYNEAHGSILGHERNLHVARMAREKGLQVLLIFDFSHDGQERDQRGLGVGDVNHFPDGSALPTGELANAEVRDAYKSELLALVEEVKPEHVRIGVEINIFHNMHPEQWPYFVQMYRDCYDAIKKAAPATEVSVYTARPPDEAMSNALRDLLPKLDSLGYSFYMDTPSEEHPRDYFLEILDLSPGLPLFIPEFGIRADSSDDALKRQARELDYMLKLFDSVNTSGLVWFSYYDQAYQDVPDWFSTSFNTIGIAQRDGTPKPALRIWESHFATPVAASPGARN